MFRSSKTVISIDLKGVIASGARAQLNNEALSSIFTKLGQLSIQKQRAINDLDNAQAKLIEEHQSLVIKEQELFKGLNEKYGDGNINLETGEIAPSA